MLPHVTTCCPRSHSLQPHVPGVRVHGSLQNQKKGCEDSPTPSHTSTPLTLTHQYTPHPHTPVHPSPSHTSTPLTLTHQYTPHPHTPVHPSPSHTSTPLTLTHQYTPHPHTPVHPSPSHTSTPSISTPPYGHTDIQCITSSWTNCYHHNIIHYLHSHQFYNAHCTCGQGGGGGGGGGIDRTNS